MRHLIAALILAAVTAIGCATTCETAASAEDTAAAVDAIEDDDGCRLRCGDYGSCSERLPYCCKGICQAEACK